MPDYCCDGVPQLGCLAIGSNECSIERLYDLYQEPPTKSRGFGASFEHMFESRRYARHIELSDAREESPILRYLAAQQKQP